VRGFLTTRSTQCLGHSAITSGRLSGRLSSKQTIQKPFAAYYEELAKSGPMESSPTTRPYATLSGMEPNRSGGCSFPNGEDSY
jgi:hypothetical protein